MEKPLPAHERERHLREGSQRRLGALPIEVRWAIQTIEERARVWLREIDLAMPSEDGFMLCSAMRTIFSQRRAHVAIIAVTAYGTPDSRARATLAGFDLYLTKPVDPVDLAGAVAGVIRRQT